MSNLRAPTPAAQVCMSGPFGRPDVHFRQELQATVLHTQGQYLHKFMIHEGEMALKVLQLAVEFPGSSIGQQGLDIEIKRHQPTRRIIVLWRILQDKQNHAQRQAADDWLEDRHAFMPNECVWSWPKSLCIQ